MATKSEDPPKGKPAKKKKDSMEAELAQLRKLAGLKEDDDSIQVASKYVAFDDVISTNNPELDRLITPDFYEKHGRGGVPRGFVCEFYGPNAGGKSSLCLMLSASVTKKKEKVLWLDIESSFYPEWAMNFGVDNEYVIHMDSNQCGETYLQLIINAAASGRYALIVVDSVTGLRPKKLMEQDLDKEARVGASASLMSRALPSVVSAAKTGNCTVVFINQIRQKISAFFVAETTPHGEALKFYSSLRIRVNRLSSRKGNRGIMLNGEEVGLRTGTKIIKSRFGPPDKEALIPIYFMGQKPDPVELLIDLCLAAKVLRVKTHKPKTKDDEESQQFLICGSDFSDIDELKIGLMDNFDLFTKAYAELTASNKALPNELVEYYEKKVAEAKAKAAEDDEEEEPQQPEAL